MPELSQAGREPRVAVIGVCLCDSQGFGIHAGQDRVPVVDLSEPVLHALKLGVDLGDESLAQGRAEDFQAVPQALEEQPHLVELGQFGQILDPRQQQQLGHQSLHAVECLMRALQVQRPLGGIGVLPGKVQLEP